MKKVLAFLIFIFAAAPCFAEQKIQLQAGSDYLYFSNEKVQSIKSNNPAIISAQRIATFTGEGNQIMFYAKKTGVADVQIQTDKALYTYSVEIKDGNVLKNNTFVELDVPEMSVK